MRPSRASHFDTRFDVIRCHGQKGFCEVFVASRMAFSLLEIRNIIETSHRLDLRRKALSIE
jgi:hypothetical protein